MEVLETARVDAYCYNDVVVSAARRGQLLCVVWEGTCVERNKKMSKRTAGDSVALGLIDEDEQETESRPTAVWHAGDWTGPIALQPDKRLSGASDQADQNDIVAMSTEGVKVITIEFASLHNVLMNGSPLYRKYLDRRTQQQRRLSYAEGTLHSGTCSATQKILTESLETLNVLDLLDQNSTLRKLSAVQKRHLESLAEGPIAFNPGERLWRSGAPVDNAYLVVAGTASFVPRRRNAGSASVPSSASMSSPYALGTLHDVRFACIIFYVFTMDTPLQCTSLFLFVTCRFPAQELGTSSNSLGDDNVMHEDVKKAVEEMVCLLDCLMVELLVNSWLLYV
jgi:hypothetical protein